MKSFWSVSRVIYVSPTSQVTGVGFSDVKTLLEGPLGGDSTVYLMEKVKQLAENQMVWLLEGDVGS